MAATVGVPAVPRQHALFLYRSDPLPPVITYDSSFYSPLCNMLGKPEH